MLAFSVNLRRCAIVGARSSVALAVIAMLVACGAKSATPSTQVAAKVGKGEVSVHQINFLLQRQGEIPPQLQAKASKDILDRLIDQELALQKAQTLKLDRDPNIMQAIEAAKRDIIARAYLEKVTSSVAKPTPEELKQYYAAHPLLFVQRRIYDVQEVNVVATPAQLNTLEPKLKGVKTSEEVLTVLRGAGVTPDVRQSTLAPENIPQGLVERFSTLKLGEPLLLNANGGLKAIFVTATRPAPLDEATALPRIETFLMAERKSKAVEQDLKALRAEMPVEYTGPFAASAASAASVPAVAAPATTAPRPSVAAPAKASSPTNIDSDTINRGLK
jgi:EpsD family peptidyl-prolyl cis-trans isomerase